MRDTLGNIAALTGARLVGSESVEVGWLLTDSRSLCFAEETLFFALESSRNDGHRYVGDLYRRGVRSFVVRYLPEGWEDFSGANFLVVGSPLGALQRLAERHREEFDIPVVGITGSNGKTVVKEWLYRLLSPDMSVTRSPRSYNSQIGVPLSVCLLHGGSEIGLFEAGISQPGEMDSLQAVVQPTIGVFTCLGEAHSEFFASQEEKCLEKLRLFRDAEVLVYCGDEECVGRCVAASGFKGRCVTWARTHDGATVVVVGEEVCGGGTKVRYRYKGEEYEFFVPMTDGASIVNALTCASVCLLLGMEPETLAARMAGLEPVAMRLEVEEGRAGCTLINDSYNSDVNSLSIALDFMCRRSDGRGRRRTLILSDMEQTGEAPEELYGRVARLVAGCGVDRFVGVGRDLCLSKGLFSGDSRFFGSTEELLGSGLLDCFADEVVLIKGARSFGFDEVSERLALRVHETTLEVNLSAVVDNLNFYRGFLHSGTKVVCMVKASAYGAGAVEVGKTLQDRGVDYLAVAVADEGVDLRKAGITSNIMVMNPEMNGFRTLFRYDLEPEVYNFRLLDALIARAEREGITGFPIHIKLDTGMHRLGFDPEGDMERLVERLSGQSAVVPRSVFSHFVGSDSEGFDSFSAHQYEVFVRAAARLQKGYNHKILRHICNSAAIVCFPDRQLDMVRLGLGLYGIEGRTGRMLHTVSTLKTTILQIRDVPKGDTVGYSRRGRVARDSRIAALPIGYADGLDRGLGCGCGYCMVNGRKAPYVGNICMDVCMIDVTDIDCKEGDTAVIFGEELPVAVLSDKTGTIPYEILTGVSGRVKRLYFQD